MNDGRAARHVARSAWGALLALGSAIAACGYDWTVVPDDPGAAADGGATVKKATCESDKDCAASSYCTFADRRCGAGQLGTCAAVTPASKCEAAALESVCTCGGQRMKSRCEAAASGVDVALDETCDEVKTTGCAPGACSAGSFCVEVAGALKHGCVPFVCAERTCACKEIATQCAGTCEVGSAGEIIVRCK